MLHNHSLWFLFSLHEMAVETQEKAKMNFPFPYTPYRIQEEFMAKLYHVLETGKIGIFESPTGTVSL